MNIQLRRNHNIVNRGSVITPTAALGKNALITQGALDSYQATEFNTRNQTKISTWNVRSLYQKGKLENVKLEMGRLECKFYELVKQDRREVEVLGRIIIVCTNQEGTIMK